jgi:hypothetical protein
MLQPYVRTSLPPRSCQKSAFKFFGPYCRVLAHVGVADYKLELPTTSKIHNVVHVSPFRVWVCIVEVSLGAQSSHYPKGWNWCHSYLGASLGYPRLPSPRILARKMKILYAIFFFHRHWLANKPILREEGMPRAASTQHEPRPNCLEPCSIISFM